MNSLGINVIQNGPNECTVETAWYAMTKAERMFLTKGHWHIDIEWKLSSNAKENVVHDLVNVYDWVMLPSSVGEKFFRYGTIELSQFPCQQLNGSFCALSAIHKTVQWYCQGCFDGNADYEGVVFVVRRRSKNEAQRKWAAASNGKMKLENYFNRQFTDHISTQNGYLENDEEHVGVANVPKKWIWNVSDDSSQLSMGIIRMPLTENMMCRPHGTPLLCLAEKNGIDLATASPNGLIDWRLMGRTMVPLVQANASGLHHDCSTWDELYEDDDSEYVNAWNGPTSSNAPMPSKKAKTMASSSSATVLSQVANALIPGAEVVLRVSSNFGNVTMFIDPGKWVPVSYPP